MTDQLKKIYEVKNQSLYKNGVLFRRLFHGAFSIFPKHKLVLYTKEGQVTIDLLPDDLVLKNGRNINLNSRN